MKPANLSMQAILFSKGGSVKGLIQIVVMISILISNHSFISVFTYSLDTEYPKKSKVNKEIVKSRTDIVFMGSFFFFLYNFLILFFTNTSTSLK